MAVSFAQVASAALARAEELLREWLPEGKRRGNEWVCGSLNGEGGESCSTNITTGQGADFASGQKWGDLVSLLAQKREISQGAACAELIKRFGLTNGAAGPTAIPRPAQHDAEPVPLNTSDPGPHSKHGAASGLHRYTDASGHLLYVVARYDPVGAPKQFCPYTWRGGKWVAKAYPAPRPLYRLADLAARPAARVLLVEGERKADLAAKLLTDWCVVSWCGGAQSVKTADWSPLKDRDVLMWPDADAPGRQAMAAVAEIILPTIKRLRAVTPTDAPEGWDVADAIKDGWDAARIVTWARDHVIAIEVQKTIPDNVVPIKGRLHDNVAPVATYGISSVVSWQSLGLECNSGGIAYAHDANVALILMHHPDIKGKIWFDEFRGEIWHDWGIAEPEMWHEDVETDVLIWLQRRMKLSKLSVFCVRRAVSHVAKLQKRNNLVAWLDSLDWDGTERLKNWLCDYLGCPNDDRHQRYGKIWLMSMVARAYHPGCKADTVPVLEGKSGRGKSGVVKIIGGDYATALDEQFGSKDFLQCLRGKWLVEIPDLAGFRGRDHTSIISAITRDTDNYRASYAQFSADHPRKCVFVITTELTSDYLQEDRGKRRFLPISCGTEVFNFEALKFARDQLFAEAVTCFKAGEPWWLPLDQDSDVQGARVSQHPWTDEVMSYAESNPHGVTSGDVLSFALRIELKDQTDGHKTAVFRILTSYGWVQTPTTRDGKRLRLWRKFGV